jgi:hypothetical protein
MLFSTLQSQRPLLACRTHRQGSPQPYTSNPFSRERQCNQTHSRVGFHLLSEAPPSKLDSNAFSCYPSITHQHPLTMNVTIHVPQHTGSSVPSSSQSVNLYNPTPSQSSSSSSSIIPPKAAVNHRPTCFSCLPNQDPIHVLPARCNVMSKKQKRQKQQPANREEAAGNRASCYILIHSASCPALSRPSSPVLPNSSELSQSSPRKCLSIQPCFHASTQPASNPK